MKMSELLNEISMYLKTEDILNSENMIPIENVKELIYELQQKENIIKEVRETLEEANEWVLGVGLKAILLEILDRDSDKK